MCSMQCAAFSVQCAVCSDHCTVCKGQWAGCSVQRVVYMCFVLCSVLKCRVSPSCGIVDPYVGYEMTEKPTEGDMDK